MSGGGGGSTTTTGVAPELKPLANEYVSRAIDMADNPFTAYKGTRFAGMNNSQQAAGNFYAQGMNAGTNPYLDQMVNKAQSNTISNYNNVIRPQLDSLAARSGSFGNAGVNSTMEQQQQALGTQLGDIATSMYGGQYNNDQAYRMQSANALQNYGNQQQANQQQGLDFNYQQFQDKLNQPYKNLQVLGAPFSMGLGSVTSTSGGGK
jgi:hypothetical protein